MSDEIQTAEADTALGKFKLTGANLPTLLSLLVLVLSCLIAWTLYAHAGDAKDGAKSVAAELKEANREVAGTLRESNREISKVLNELAQAMRERNCLDAFEPVKRMQNAELCKRLSR